MLQNNNLMERTLKVVTGFRITPVEPTRLEALRLVAAEGVRALCVRMRSMKQGVAARAAVARAWVEAELLDGERVTPVLVRRLCSVLTLVTCLCCAPLLLQVAALVWLGAELAAYRKEQKGGEG